MDTLDLSEISDDVALEQLGARLSRYRLNRTLTQAHLAHEAGLSRKTVSKAELGQPIDLISLVRILRALKLNSSLDGLLPPEPESPLRVAAQELTLRRRARPRASDGKKDVNRPWPD
ncbi:helix-turn-helix domain-containing protein [Salinisphaera aquimarina]|uniref:Helix-turn-helix domain-containing protein n=1 Tax=Salinisphaera aquimarina TaxID=2094031 RepID=A0ABV7EPP8_9GAMM